MSRSTIIALTSHLALFIAATTAGAQDGPTIKGFSVGVHGAATVHADSDAPSGHGLSLALGYGLTNRLAVQAFTSGTRVTASGDRDGYFQSFIDAEGRYHLGRTDGTWRPHLAVGVSARNVHDEPEADEDGDTSVRTTIGPTAGGGLSYFATRSLSVDAAVRYTFRDAQRTRAFVGVSWYPRAR